MLLIVFLSSVLCNLISKEKVTSKWYTEDSPQLVQIQLGESKKNQHKSLALYTSNEISDVWYNSFTPISKDIPENDPCYTELPSIKIVTTYKDYQPINVYTDNPSLEDYRSIVEHKKNIASLFIQDKIYILNKHEILIYSTIKLTNQIDKFYQKIELKQVIDKSKKDVFFVNIGLNLYIITKDKIIWIDEKQKQTESSSQEQQTVNRIRDVKTYLNYIVVVCGEQGINKINIYVTDNGEIKQQITNLELFQLEKYNLRNVYLFGAPEYKAFYIFALDKESGIYKFKFDGQQLLKQRLVLKFSNGYIFGMDKSMQRFLIARKINDIKTLVIEFQYLKDNQYIENESFMNTGYLQNIIVLQNYALLLSDNKVNVFFVGIYEDLKPNRFTRIFEHKQSIPGLVNAQYIENELAQAQLLGVSRFKVFSYPIKITEPRFRCDLQNEEIQGKTFTYQFEVLGKSCKDKDAQAVQFDYEQCKLIKTVKIRFVKHYFTEKSYKNIIIVSAILVFSILVACIAIGVLLYFYYQKKERDYNLLSNQFQQKNKVIFLQQQQPSTRKVIQISEENIISSVN